jgi:hypothetical protein
MDIEKMDILTLDNKDYVVLEIVPNNSKLYYCLTDVDQDENIIGNIRLMFLAQANGKTGLADIKDKDELENIKDLFTSRLKFDYMD